MEYNSITAGKLLPSTSAYSEEKERTNKSIKS
jgi:hypothetical protein